MKYWLTYMALLCAILNDVNSCFANNDTLKLKLYADSVYKHKKYYEASIYYQKLDYFLQGIENKASARVLSAMAYNEMKDYHAAIDILEKTNLVEASDSSIYKVKFQLALIYYLDNDLPNAKTTIEQLTYLIKDSLIAYRSYLLKTIILNDLYQWSDARITLQKYNMVFTTNSFEKENNKLLIDSLYNSKNFPKLKNPDKAATMSTFLPGLGQAYSKNYLEGVTSFISVVTAAGLMVTGIYFQYYFSSLIVGNLLISKFHQGGVNRAEFLVNKYNYKKSLPYNLKLRTNIKSIFVK